MNWPRVREMFRSRPPEPRPPESSPSDLERAKTRAADQADRVDRLVDSYVRASHAIRR